LAVLLAVFRNHDETVSVESRNGAKIAFLADGANRDSSHQSRSFIRRKAGLISSFIQRCKLFSSLLLATSSAVRNGIQDTLGSRPFWVFLAIAYCLWALDQWLFIYYELGRHIEVPNNSIADPVLFLHIVPLMAAVATLPHWNVSDRKLYRAILNPLKLLFFWSFLYGYFVFPYQYLFSSSATPSSYAMRFDTLYLLENLALVVTVAILTLRVQAPWKSIYLHLFGASTLYALSSAVANLAIDSGGYVNGKLYGLGLTAAVCWFVWIPLRARQEPGAEGAATLFDSSQSSQGSIWAMLLVVMISIPIVWELFERNENTGPRTLRLLVAIAAIVCLASAAYINEYLARLQPYGQQSQMGGVATIAPSLKLVLAFAFGVGHHHGQHPFMNVNSRYSVSHELPPARSGERAATYINQGRGLLLLLERKTTTPNYSLNHARSGSDKETASAYPLLIRPRPSKLLRCYPE
jgi:hypothetical protein